MLKIAGHWFERRRIDDSLTLLWEPHVDPLLRCNIWHLRGRDRDLLVDSGMGIASLREAGRDLFGHAVVAVATHAHLDHVGGLHEFDDRRVHATEAAGLAAGPAWGGLLREQYSPEIARYLEKVGYPLPPLLVSALPYAGFDLAGFRQEPCQPTMLLAEGDRIDLGDRSFEVLHLPGHSPGSVGLWEASTGLLFSGDAIYDGPLLDALPDSDRIAYASTMRRLRDLPVDVVHGGHDGSFGRARFRELIEGFLAGVETS